MDLALPRIRVGSYKSATHRARVATEGWAEENLYCPECDSNRLNRSRAGMPAIDFNCPDCEAPFQLKSSSKPFGQRITDAAYEAMRRAIEEDRTPHLVALHYGMDSWDVHSVLLVPRFAFSLAAVERRKPLSSTARRAGWVGCNILLSAIPESARIHLIENGVVAPRKLVRDTYQRLRPLGRIQAKARGWTLDVLRVVESLGKTEFTLPEVYAHEARLQRLHPDNRHVQDKIRQQLQRLRDLGFLDFTGPGRYRLR